MLEREYYSLSAAVEQLGWRVEDLLHYAATGRLKLYLPLGFIQVVEFEKTATNPQPGHLYIPRSDGLLQVPELTCEKLELNDSDITNVLYATQGEYKNHPVIPLLEEGPIVIRRSDVVILRADLDRLTADKTQDSTLRESERTALLKIIRVLALGCKLDLSKPYKAAETIEALAACHGVTIPSAKSTLPEKLKQAKNLPD